MGFVKSVLFVSVLAVLVFFQCMSTLAESEIPNSATVVDFEGSYQKSFGILTFPEGADFFDAHVATQDVISDTGFLTRSGDRMLLSNGRFGIYAYFDQNVTGEVYATGAFFSGIGGVLTAFDKNGNVLSESKTACCDFVLNQKLYVESTSVPIYLVLFSREIRYSRLSIDDFFFISQKETCKLDVPLYLQTDPLWKNDKYGNVWWSERGSSRTIEYEGCAVSSASMVLSYYGSKESGIGVSPSTLNAWLRSQPAGYVGGSVNWFSVAKYAREVMGVGLWYRGRESFNNDLLSFRLCSGEPIILELTGHFVVAKGIKNGSFTINDPLGRSSILSQYYGNRYKSTRRFSTQEKDSRGRMQSGYLIIDSDAESDFHVVSPSGESFYTSGDESRNIEIDSPVSGKYVVVFDESENITNAKLYIASGNASGEETLHEVEAIGYIEFYFDSASNNSTLYLPIVSSD